MKREALKHPKMLDLACRLGTSREHAVGLVTCLLDWCIDFATAGDIGKHPDGAIAMACGMADAERFIQALIASRWLDKHPVHRLVIHDWPDHAERFVKSKLVAQREWFLRCYYADGRCWDAPQEGLLAASDRETVTRPLLDVARHISMDISPDTSADPPRDQTKPNQTKPNQTNGHRLSDDEFVAYGKFKGGNIAFRMAWDAYPEGGRTKQVIAAQAWDEAARVISARTGQSLGKTEDWLLEQIKAYAKSPKGQSQFCDGMANWLKNGQYDDPPNAWNSRSKPDRKTKVEKPSDYQPLTPPKKEGRDVTPVMGANGRVGAAAQAS